MKTYILLVICTLCYVECVYKRYNLASNNDVTWTVKNQNGSVVVPGKVPGGIYSDLMKAGVIGDIFEGFNDVLTRWVAYDNWTYTGQFQVTEDQLSHEVLQIVFEGVDTIAFIELNDVPIGNTENMFVRYVFDVKDSLKVGNNELKISFVSPVEAAARRSEEHFAAPNCVPSEYHGECHANQLRKMQASFSWDWGPAFPSVGLWKLAYLESYNGAIIRSVTTHISKKGQEWHLRIRAYMESSPRNVINGYLKATLNVDANQRIETRKYLEIPLRNDGLVTEDIEMTISENLVSVWWPNGYGDQSLYDLKVYLVTDEDLEGGFHKSVKVGFRTIEVVEENASLKFGNTTAGTGLTFYFKINGYRIFMKGSNWIPAHILPEYGYNRNTVNELLLYAKDTNMAMLRVWGGGVYESDYFYRRCDELGILIWQDFLFACSMYPADKQFLDNVKTEIEQNVIRLQHHPSIALWAGNNENEVALRGNWYGTLPEFEKYKTEYIKLYVDTIKPIVEELDPGRRYLVSSPSNGLESEKEDYVAQNPYDSHYGDTHYYNYMADNWDANIYPNTRFASEYGFQSLPSLATMHKATQNKEDFDIDSAFSKHRQHSPNGYEYIESQIERHLYLDKNATDYVPMFVHYSQITQAMAMKTETEFYRQSQENWYTMGALYWQLNDVWQAPSWSGIEYGGRWKMLHYFAKSFFAPVLVSPRLLSSGDVDVYLINDRFVPIIDGQIIVSIFNWSSLEPISTETYSAKVGPLSSKKQKNIALDLWQMNGKEIFLRFELVAEGVMSAPYNYVFPKPLKTVSGLKEPNIQISVGTPIQLQSKLIQYIITVNVDTVVLFLWLETHFEGHFDDNGIVVTTPSLRIRYQANTWIPPDKLKQSITYHYYIH